MSEQEPLPVRPMPTEREVRLAMFELRAEIKAAQEKSRKLAPKWDPQMHDIVAGPGGRYIPPRPLPKIKP